MVSGPHPCLVVAASPTHAAMFARPQPRRALVATVLLATALATPAAAQEPTVEVPAQAPAQPPAPRLRGIARFGLEDGGDKVLSFQYEDGSTPDITAGGGMHLSVGAAYRALQTRAGALDAQLALGLKWRTIPPAENQDANWLRFPLDAMMVFRSTRGFGIGAGTTVHLGNALRASGAVANGSVEFANTPGFLVQAEYAWRGAIFDVRYTGMQYELSDATAAEKVDASSIGVGISMMFGRHGIVR